MWVNKKSLTASVTWNWLTCQEPARRQSHVGPNSSHSSVLQTSICLENDCHENIHILSGRKKITISNSFQRGADNLKNLEKSQKILNKSWSAFSDGACKQVLWFTFLKENCAILKLTLFQSHRNGIMLPRGWHTASCGWWNGKSLQIILWWGLLSSLVFFALKGCLCVGCEHGNRLRICSRVEHWELCGNSIQMPALQIISFLPFLQRKMMWKRAWQPTLVFLPGESHGWRRLVGPSPRGRKESDTTERLHFLSLSLWDSP